MNWIAGFVVVFAVVVLIDARSFIGHKTQKRELNSKNTWAAIIGLVQSEADLKTMITKMNKDTLENYRNSILEGMTKIEELVMVKEQKYTKEQKDLGKKLTDLYNILPNIDPEKGDNFLRECHDNYMKADFSGKKLEDAKTAATKMIDECAVKGWTDMKTEFVDKTKDLEDADSIVDAMEKLHAYAKELITLGRFRAAVAGIDWMTLVAFKVMQEKEAVQYLQQLMETKGVINVLLKDWAGLIIHDPTKQTDDSSVQDDNDDSSVQNDNDQNTDNGNKKRNMFGASYKAFGRSKLTRQQGGSKFERIRMLAKLLTDLRK